MMSSTAKVRRGYGSDASGSPAFVVEPLAGGSRAVAASCSRCGGVLVIDLPGSALAALLDRLALVHRCSGV